jgi:hypothetical protein
MLRSGGLTYSQILGRLGSEPMRVLTELRDEGFVTRIDREYFLTAVGLTAVKGAADAERPRNS